MSEHIQAHSERLERYFALTAERPELFRQSEELQIVLDCAQIASFEQKKGKRIGVHYSSDYSFLLVDLVKKQDGELFAFERVVPAVPSGAVVIAPVFDGQFVLLKQFRHAIRDYQLAFPRGYGENGVTAIDNAQKEIKEELNAEVLSIRELGKLTGDSGLSGSVAMALYAEISRPKINPGYEEIVGLSFIPCSEMTRFVHSGQITDGYTLATYALIGDD